MHWFALWKNEKCEYFWCTLLMNVVIRHEKYIKLCVCLFLQNVFVAFSCQELIFDVKSLTLIRNPNTTMYFKCSQTNMVISMGFGDSDEKTDFHLWDWLRCTLTLKLHKTFLNCISVHYLCCRSYFAPTNHIVPSKNRVHSKTAALFLTDRSF